MSQAIVPKHKRRVKGKWKLVRGYTRVNRGLGKKRIIAKTPTKLYLIRDEYGQLKGYSGKKG